MGKMAKKHKKKKRAVLEKLPIGDEWSKRDWPSRTRHAGTLAKTHFQDAVSKEENDSIFPRCLNHIE